MEVIMFVFISVTSIISLWNKSKFTYWRPSHIYRLKIFFCLLTSPQIVFQINQLYCFIKRPNWWIIQRIISQSPRWCVLVAFSWIHPSVQTQTYVVRIWQVKEIILTFERLGSAKVCHLSLKSDHYRIIATSCIVIFCWWSKMMFQFVLHKYSGLKLKIFFSQSWKCNLFRKCQLPSILII